MKIRSTGAAGALIATGLLTLGAAPLIAASPGPAASPAPVCGDGAPPSWVTTHHDATDGVPDPAGRIVFGQLTRVDAVLGQLVSLYAIDPDGSDLVQLLDCETARPRFSPDGSRLAFAIIASDGHLQVATMAVDGSDLRILPTPSHSETPDWSPDGSWLIYSHTTKECPVPDCLSSLGVREPLWRMDADGSDQRLIGQPDVVDLEPRFSPDGREVVFQRILAPDFADSQLMIRDLATGAERVATATGRGEEHPDWSRDGKSIIYNTADTTGHPYLFEQIERVPSDDATAVPEVLYPSDASQIGWKPAYSPDGSRIAFFCNDNLCTMDADGSHVQVVLSVPGRELNHVTWGITPRPAR